MEHSWKLNTIALSVLAIILAYMGYTTLVFLILGFAVIALKDEELTKNILDVFLLTFGHFHYYQLAENDLQRNLQFLCRDCQRCRP